MNTARRILLQVLLLAFPMGGAWAETASFDEPSLDRWMYGVNSSPGTRQQASLFADPDDWSRLGQFMLGFETSAEIATGEGPERYQIISVAVTLVASGQPTFEYDADYDTIASYTGTDEDTGRPLELHGVGFRNGYVATDFLIPATPISGPGGRTAYPMGWDGGGAERDVSMNVSGGFESEPWAVGEVVGANDGDTIDDEADVRFELDLSDPRVVAYLQEALDTGALYFMATSLQPAVQQGGTFVNFFTKDSQEHFLFGGYAPTLEIEYAIGDPPPADLPPMAIESVVREAGMITIGWQQVAGATYIVESTVNGETWSEERRETAAVSGAATFTASTASQPSAMFRVKREANS